VIAVRPEFRPTLPELLAPAPRALRIGLLGIYAVVVAVVLWLALLEGDGSTHVVQRSGPVEFNISYKPPLRRSRVLDGELLRLTGPDGRVAAFSPLRLPPYRGFSDGFLPLYAESLVREMRRAYPGFRRREDGRPSVNFIPGYEIVFQYDNRGRTAYGKRLLLLSSYAAGARNGIDLTILENRGRVAPTADDVGNGGPLKFVLRSLAFGPSPPL
jgi:hypothetical protein